jgi:ParB-like chromosome segregation protein Spo0J
MKEIGQQHPCIVTVLREDHYQIVASERRWRAAIRAGMLKFGVSSRLI